MRTIPETAPVISYDDDLGESGKRIDVEYDRLMFALGHMGISELISAQTSINFYGYNGGYNEYLGSTAHDRILDELMFKIPGFRQQTAYRMGFRPHQAGYPHKIAIAANPGFVTKTVKDSLLSKNEASPKDIKKLRAGDCIALVLAHEFGHILNHINKDQKQGRRKEERKIRAYVADCVSLGRHSPWAGVVRVRD